MKPILTFLTAGAIAVSAALPAWADKLPLSKISDYFNDLKTAESSFRQFNEDGSTSTGRLFIKRPGRMRFEYDAPESALVLASSGAVVIFDTKSNQPPETYNLRQTPLSLILARNVNLERARMVVDHSFDGTHTLVTAQDPANPEYGSIVLAFSAEPLELRGWTVNDSNGGRTQVVLGELAKGGAMPNKMFDISQSRPKLDR